MEAAMSAAFEQAFWQAVDDINAGRMENVDRYLELVPTEQRDELAALLANVLASRGPGAQVTPVTAEGYNRALAAIDEVNSSLGPSGVLPGALRTMRHSRGIERETVVNALAQDFEIESAAGRKALERFYHQLESGKLLGPRLARRLLASLARIFDIDIEDLIAGAEPSRVVTGRAPVAAMGRPGAATPPRTRGEPARPVTVTDDEKLVERLFAGGRDA